MLRRLAHVLGGIALATVLGAVPAAAETQLRESGTVEIDQTQVALFFSGSLGGGVLHFKGKDYKFTLGGVGVGGLGGSTIQATGTVYNLDRVEDFDGAYGQARIGYAAGSDSSGSMWLQNVDGVYIKLDAKREGIMLSAGGDAIYIDFDK